MAFRVQRYLAMTTVTLHADPEVRNAEKEISRTNDPANPQTAELQRVLADSIVLFSNYKFYHWQMNGPHFRDYHLMFDEFAGQALEGMDEVAERIRMIGQDPVHHPEDVSRLATVRWAQASGSYDLMIQEADEQAILAIAGVRRAIESAEASGDPGTVDMLAKIVRDIEKQEWYLRQLLA
jgi:starvation-inducible DNA-binding protein